MNVLYNLRRICLTCLFAALPWAAPAAVDQAELRQAGGQFLVVEISDLRSAYLHRAGVVHYDPAEATPEGIRRQLQRHFDAVLRILLASTPASIETALDRLEAARSESWSNDERAAWRQRLLERRLAQLLRLKDYRDRGVFPLNEGQADRPVPIFVDRHDTACAVGHLMRLAGCEAAVEEIRAANNLVYVPDVESGDLVQWTLESGLTLEEAALIQPMYGPGGPGGGIGFPPLDIGLPLDRDLFRQGSTFTGVHDAGEFEPGGSVLEMNGLRFANFRVESELSGEFVVSPFRAAVGGLGLLTGVGDYVGPDLGGDIHIGPRIEREFHYPQGTHWMAIGVPRFREDPASDAVATELHSLGGYAVYGASQRIIVRFDVSTIDPNARINGITQTSSTILHGFSDLYSELSRSSLGLRPAEYSMTTRVLAGEDEIGAAYFDQGDIEDATFPTFQDGIAFGAASHLTVETEIWLEDGAQLRTYLLDFNVVSVPEPSTWSLLVIFLIGGGAVVAFGRKRAPAMATSMATRGRHVALSNQSASAGGSPRA